MNYVHRITVCVLLFSLGYFSSLDSQHQSNDGEIILTFVTANDGHWRPTEIHPTFDLLNQLMIDAINDRGDVDLVIFNGDVVDRYAYIEWWNEQNPDSPLSDRDSSFNIHWLYDVKELYEQLEMPFYVVQGNHDRATWDYWEGVWGYPAKHHFSIHDYAFVLLTRHDDRLTYHPVDYDWLDEVLTSYQEKHGVFIFIHAGDNGVMNPTFQEFIDYYPNVRGVFFGHFHTDDIEYINGLHYFWNGNFMNPIVDYGYRVVYVYEYGKIDTYFMNLALDEKTNHVIITPTTVSDTEQTAKPVGYKLNRNYPNPFNPSTNISYAIPQLSDVNISVYNVIGQRIDILVDQRLQPGYYQITWTPPPHLSSGMYIYRLRIRSVDTMDLPITIQQSMLYLR